jgi:hypothetical protein
MQESQDLAHHSFHSRANQISHSIELKLNSVPFVSLFWLRLNLVTGCCVVFGQQISQLACQLHKIHLSSKTPVGLDTKTVKLHFSTVLIQDSIWNKFNRLLSTLLSEHLELDSAQISYVEIGIGKQLKNSSHR